MYIDPGMGGIAFQAFTFVSVCATSLALIAGVIGAVFYALRKAKKK